MKKLFWLQNTAFLHPANALNSKRISGQKGSYLAFVLVCAMCLPLTGCELAHLAAGSQQQHVQAARTDVPSPAVAVSPADRPAALAARSVSRWLYAAAGFCLIACAALGYFGQVWPAVKCGIAGITLPIFAAWYSEHWAWVIAGLLVAFAIYFLVYQHRFISPLVKRIEELEVGRAVPCAPASAGSGVPALPSCKAA
jgi:hypothetical protein